MRRLPVLALALAALAPSAHAQRRPAPPARTSASDTSPEARLRAADLAAHLRFLASDELMGRAPGTPGIDAAARYVAEQFRRFGVRTAPGQADYYQRFTLARVTPGATTLRVGEAARTGAQAAVVSGRPFAGEGRGVYVGYGASAADYAGRDVQGMIVVARVGAAGQTAPRALVDLGARKRRLADSLGAVALVELYDAPAPWASVGARYARTRVEMDYAETLAHVWVDDAQGALRAAFEAQPEQTTMLNTRGLAVAPMRVQNVVGYVEGTDPRLKAEVVALSAHHDHLGAGMRNGADATPADSIFNGARDNATGTAALLGAAEALAARPPRRSVLLLSYTAEEMGLLGARYFADHPVVPLASIVANLNVDTGGISDTSVVSFVGATRTSLTPLVAEASRAFGLGLYQSADIDPLFNASDNAPLAARGIPAPTFSPGFRSLRDSLVARYYHRAADHADAAYPFGYLHRFTQAYARAARLIADAPARPRWTPGDAFEPAARALYGPAY